jgi:hypothetical protein
VGTRPRRLVAYALGAVAMFSLLGMSCGATSQPYVGPAGAPKLYVVGDSITYQATDDLNAQFQSAYQVRIDGSSGASSQYMSSRAQAAAASGPDVAVVELGTNDPVPLYGLTLAQSETWLETIDGWFPLTTCVVFVTPWSGTVSRPPGALAAIDQFERSTFARIADWDAAATPDDYAGGDGIHPNSSGRQHLMQVEAAAVATCPPSTSTTTTIAESTTTTAVSTSTSDSTTTTTESTSTSDSTTTTTVSTSTSDSTTTTTASTSTTASTTTIDSTTSPSSTDSTTSTSPPTTTLPP